MKSKKTELNNDLTNLKFSDVDIISVLELKQEIKKVMIELEEISQKKKINYEKLKEVVRL